MVGDWMGSIYGVDGRRCDWRLFLDHDGRFERTVQVEPDYERRDAGRWEYDEPANTLRLISETPDETGHTSSAWFVLSVKTCEESNVLLVLREIVLASRNLPILFYRVHGAGRGYGTNWQERVNR